MVWKEISVEVRAMKKNRIMVQLGMATEVFCRVVKRNAFLLSRSFISHPKRGDKEVLLGNSQQTV